MSDPVLPAKVRVAESRWEAVRKNSDCERGPASGWGPSSSPTPTPSYLRRGGGGGGELKEVGRWGCSQR